MAGRLTMAAITDYSRFISRLGSSREPSPIRLLTQILQDSPKTMISLAGGMPNPSLFPFTEASFKLRDGSTLEIDGESMKTALQYGASQGDPSLLKHIRNLVAHYHNPPTMSRPASEGGLDFCMISGAMDGLDKAMLMMVNPGDHVLVENPTYSGFLSSLNPIGCRLIPVDNDTSGLRPDKLRAALSRWTPDAVTDPHSDIPKVLYTVPNGANPTGFSLTEQRKREIYQIAQEYNLIIIEDDPYYFLQFKKPYAPSFLQIDTDGRVLRFDSFSKILSSGMRLGFVSGPQPLVYRIVLHTMAANIHASGLSQVLTSQLFDQWGLEGFEKHAQGVVDFYRQRKEVTMAAAEKWLTGLADWSEPEAGMFLWIKLRGISDTKKLIEEKAKAKEVLLAPGSIFNVDPAATSNHVRAAFSLASPEQIDQGFQRLASLIQDELEAGENVEQQAAQ